MQTFTSEQRLDLARQINQLRADLLRMQHALRRDDDLSDYQATMLRGSAGVRWLRIQKRIDGVEE